MKLNGKLLKSIWVILLCAVLLVGCSKQHNSVSSATWYADKINLSELHKISTGSNALIALIDTGVKNEFLEEHSNNVSATFNVLDGTDNVEDEHGHGTEMASVLLGDKDLKITGICPEAKLIIIKAIDETGATDNSYIAEAIMLAVENNCDIINLSVGSMVGDKNLKKAVDKAIEKNVLICASCGDYDINDLLYPAAYKNVISVQGIDKDGKIIEMSNTSEQTVVSFPGESIETVSYDSQNKESCCVSGSSEATAIASGYFALYISSCKESNKPISSNETLNRIIKTRNTDKTLNYMEFMEPNNAGLN